MKHIGLDWSSLWLGDVERSIVQHHDKTGVWLTVGQFLENTNGKELQQ